MRPPRSVWSNWLKRRWTFRPSTLRVRRWKLAPSQFPGSRSRLTWASSDRLLSPALFRIDLGPAAARSLRRLDRAAQVRIQAALELLASNPRPTGARHL